MSAELSSFIVSKTAVGLSLRTVKWYATFVQQFADWSKTQGLTMTKPESVEAYLAFLRKEGRSAFTISGCYRALSVYFKWMVQRGKLRRSPIDSITPPQTPIKRVKYITPSQFRLLYESFPGEQWWQRRDKAILMVLFYCGLRANEMLDLQLKSIDRERKLLFVTEGKGGKDRDVPCADEVIAEIDLYLEARPDYGGTELFIARNKGAYAPRGPLLYDGLKEMLRRRCKAAGMQHYSAHKFRHAYAMTFANAGMPLSALAASMGHSSVIVTERFYARWQTESLSAVYNTALGKIGMVGDKAKPTTR